MCSGRACRLQCQVTRSSFATNKRMSEIESLREKAQKHTDDLEFGAARELLTKALQIDPKNVAVLDSLGECLMELGEAPEAFKVFTESAKLAPEENPSKFMYMAQCQSGQDALQSFSHGINILLKSRSTHEASSSKDEKLLEDLDKQVSDAYCSMSEIYCTDLCDDADAEKMCGELLDRAVAQCARNPDAHAAMANFRLLQNRVDDARQSIQHAVDLLSKNPEIVAQCSLELLSSLAKLCFEVERFEDSARILDLAICMNDSSSELWYLAAFSHYQLKGYQASRLYAEETRKRLKSDPNPDIAEALNELDQQLKVKSDEDGDADDEAEDDEDEAMDAEELAELLEKHGDELELHADERRREQATGDEEAADTEMEAEAE